MNSYVVNQQIRLTATFRDLNGTLRDPTAVVFKVKNVAGEVTEYTTPARDSTGIYHQDIVLSSGGGTWSYRAEGSGEVIGANESQLNVIGTAF